MSNRVVEVGLKIKGDSVGAVTSIETTEKALKKLGDAGKVELLIGAEQRARDIAVEIERTRQNVQSLEAALSEAYAAGADDRLINDLSKRLRDARIEAGLFSNAAEKNSVALNRLKLAAHEAGINIENLSAEKLRLELLAQSTARLQSSFDKLNIRTAKAIEADILGVNQALLALANRADVSGDEFDRAFAAGQQRIAALKAELKGVPDEMGRVEQKADSLQGMMRKLALGFSGIELARQFITANVSLEALDRSLTQITGSSAKAAAEIQWLKEVTNRMGVDTLSASRAYVGLAASAKGTALEGDGTRRIFEAVAGSMAKIGKSSADTEGALEALSQMMGKGTVSMEEMRQQLAERLPGAMKAAADGAGVTVAELTEMIGTGQVLAEDLLPKLAAGLEKMYGTGTQTEGTISAWNRLKNVVAETFQFIGNSGVMTAITNTLGQVAIAVRGLTGAFELLGKIVGITFGALAAFDFSSPIQSIKNWKQAVSEAAAEIQERMDKAKTSTEGVGQAQQGLGDKTKAAAEAAQASGPSWLSLLNTYTQLSTAAKTGTEQAVKSADARAEEGKAALSLANALGSESDKRNTAISVAKTDAAALKNVAMARELEAEVARDQAAAMSIVAEAEDKVSDAKRKAIKEANDKATALQSEAEKALAVALAAQQHTAVLEVQSAALKDNSASVHELKAANEQALAAMIALGEANLAGKASLAEVQTATIAAAQADALYRDALGDVTEAIQNKANASKSANSLSQAETSLALQQVRNAAELAHAKGDETEAIRLKNQASQLEIELAQLKADALRLEAKAQLELVAAKRKELEASGELTPAKKAELAAMEASAKVKQVEADSADLAARHMAELTKVTKEAKDAAEAAGNSFGNMANGLDASARKIERLAEGVERVGNGFRNAQGWASDAQGNAITSGGKSSWSDWTSDELADLLSGRKDQASTAPSQMRDPATLAAAQAEVERRRQSGQNSVGGPAAQDGTNRVSGQGGLGGGAAQSTPQTAAPAGYYEIKLTGADNKSTTVLSTSPADLISLMSADAARSNRL